MPRDDNNNQKDESDRETLTPERLDPASPPYQPGCGLRNFVDETRERIHEERRSHDDEEVAVIKILGLQVEEGGREALAKEDDVGAEHAKALWV